MFRTFAGFFKLLLLTVSTALFHNCGEPTSMLKSRWETQDGVVVVIDTLYYTIEGTTLEQLGEQMRRLGPKDGEIPRYAATEYDIRWTYRLRPRVQRCTLTDIEVGARILVTFPRWDPPDGTALGSWERWQRFSDALRSHEIGHRDLALRAAGKILRKIRSLQGSLSCGDLDMAASFEARSILNEFRNIQAEYDSKTQNGFIQGAHF